MPGQQFCSYCGFPTNQTVPTNLQKNEILLELMIDEKKRVNFLY